VDSAAVSGIMIGGGFRTLKDSSILNSGSIETETNIDGTQGGASGSASGIFSDTVVNSTIDNSGSISSSVKLSDIGENTSISDSTEDAAGSANGISAGHVENSKILNSGSIISRVDLNSIGGEIIPFASALGIQIWGSEPPETLEDSTIVNTGSIKTNVNLANIAGDAGAFSGGIYVNHAISDQKPSTIDNQGTIDVSVTTDNSPNTLGFGAAGVMVKGSESKIQVNNSGRIKLNVSELGDFEEPANFEEDMANTHIASAALFAGTTADFSNTGRLYTSGNARALSLYKGSDVTLQDGFGYVFHGKPAETKRPIYNANSTLDLNSVSLIADGAPDTVLGKPYYLVDQNSTVENTWGALKKEYANPNITVDWYGDNRAEESAVIFGYEPRKSKSARAGIAARTAVNTGQNQLLQYLLSGHVFGGQGFLANNEKDAEPILLASAGTSDAVSLGTAGPAYKNGAYILPYYTGVHDSGLGADITSKGVFLGYERSFDAITAGVFGGYGNNSVRLNDTFKRNDEDQDSYSAGAYGIYNQESWFGELYASYNRIKHDYSGWTGMNYQIRETDEYDSDMFLTEARAGMKFEDSDWGIYPSMSLRWTNWRTETHTSKVSANPDWNTHYDSLSEEWFQVFAGIDASRKWSLEGGGNISLTSGAGIKQDLNDNDIEVTQSLMGQSAVVEESVASTSAVLNITGVYSRDAFRVKLGVISEHNEDYDSYNGYLQAGFVW
ncbi:MAG: autotransporter outer membrane beta-barrel domain-containing protein, partial [Desulfosalsimonas sp.]